MPTAKNLQDCEVAAPSREKWSESHIRKLYEHRDSVQGLVNRLYGLSESLGCSTVDADDRGDGVVPSNFIARSDDVMVDIAALMEVAHKIANGIAEEF